MPRIAQILNVSGAGHAENGLVPFRLPEKEMPAWIIDQLTNKKTEDVACLRNPWGTYRRQFYLAHPTVKDAIRTSWWKRVNNYIRKLGMKPVFYGPTPWRINIGTIEDPNILTFGDEGLSVNAFAQAHASWLAQILEFSEPDELWFDSTWRFLEAPGRPEVPGATEYLHHFFTLLKDKYGIKIGAENLPREGFKYYLSSSAKLISDEPEFGRLTPKEFEQRVQNSNTENMKVYGWYQARKPIELPKTKTWTPMINTWDEIE